MPSKTQAKAQARTQAKMQAIMQQKCSKNAAKTQLNDDEMSLEMPEKSENAMEKCHQKHR